MSFDHLSHTVIWILGTLLFMLRYVLVAGVFFYVLYVWKKKQFTHLKIQKSFPKLPQIKREVFYSMITFTIYGSGIWLFLFWIENGHTQIYKDVSEFGIPYFVVSILLMIVIHDTYFYWTHRLIHHSKLFKYVHKVHHSFTSPTPWAAFAFHPLEAIITIGVIPVILFTVPYHQFALIVFISFLTVYNVLIHLGFTVPGLKRLQFTNTPEAHDLHHQGSSSNYGLYFTFWDRIMGTFRVA
jgi:sterol desaturase/sphingolipid hydroxylase (fatty acid hydroxylase superfamily)